MVKNTREFHISDYIKTDEDVHNLLAAEREPYEKALRIALALLKVLADYQEQEGAYYEASTGKTDWILMVEHMCKQRLTIARLAHNKIIKDLAAEGIPDPTELKDNK